MNPGSPSSLLSKSRKYQLKYDLILGLLGSHEGDAGLVCGLSEGLVSGAQSSEAAGVGGEEAGHAAGAVVDLKLCPIRLVAAGRGAIVAVVCS